MVSKVPAVPAVPMGTPPELVHFLNAVKSSLDVVSGTSGSAAVTQEELEEALRNFTPAEGGGGGGGGGNTVITVPGTPTNPDPPDTTPPPSPTGLRATGGFSTVILEWDALPSSPPIAFVTVYRAAVDDFSRAAAVGTARVLLYADYVPDSQNYYYWITFTTEAGIEGPPNSGTGTLAAASLDPSYTKQVLEGAITDLEIADEKLTGFDVIKDLTVTQAVIGEASIITAKIGEAAIVTAHIQDLAVVSAKILDLAADKIVAASLSAVSANLGEVTAGRMLSPDQTFLIDLNGKEILISGPNGQVADDYTIFRNGQIEAYQWTGSGHVLSKGLRGLQTGVANNGATVSIPGYFRNQPRIIVSPANVPSFLKDFQDQDQVMQCVARNITQVGDGQWQFEAVAQLVVGDGTERQSPGLSFSDSPIEDQYLGEVMTTANGVTQIAVQTGVRTFQSTGTAGEYRNRQVTVHLEYSVAGQNNWVVAETETVEINQELLPVQIDVESGTLPANQYDVRLRYVFLTLSGTYEGSGAGLQPAETTVFGPSTQTITQNGNGTRTRDINTGAWTPPAGAVGIEVNYSYNWSANATVEYLFTTGTNSSTISGLGGTTREFLSVSVNSNNPGENPKFRALSGTYSAQGAGSYDPNFLRGQVRNRTVTGGSADGTLTVSGAQALIRWQEPASTDTNPHNFATWDTLIATLSGSTVLSEGTVNWQAIGES